MINDSIKVTGELKLTLTRPDGHVKHEVIIPNLVVTTGKNYIASRIKDASATAMTHMSIGTGSTAAAASDTALGSEAGRVALTSTTVSTNNIAYVATFAAGTGKKCPLIVISIRSPIVHLSILLFQLVDLGLLDDE